MPDNSAPIRTVGLNVELQLTPLGERMVALGKVARPVKVTPELIALRKKVTDAARKKSRELKAERRKQIEADLESGKRKPLPPMTRVEKMRVDELAKRAAAHKKADAERVEAAKKTADSVVIVGDETPPTDRAPGADESE